MKINDDLTLFSKQNLIFGFQFSFYLGFQIEHSVCMLKTQPCE